MVMKSSAIKNINWEKLSKSRKGNQNRRIIARDISSDKKREYFWHATKGFRSYAKN